MQPPKTVLLGPFPIKTSIKVKWTKMDQSHTPHFTFLCNNKIP